MKDQNQQGFTTSTLISIVAIIIICGGLYIYINKDNVSLTVKNTEATTGIIITSIKSDDLVKLPITVSGYLDGNGWAANEGEVGTVQVFDANGKALSNQELIRTTSVWHEFPTYFSATVGDRQMMSEIETNTGLIKITANRAKDGEMSKTVTIPIRFK